MIKNFFKGCRYFCLGLIEMNRQKRTKTFTRVFSGIGEMTGKGTSPSKCRAWYMTMPHYLCWNDVKVCITEKWKDENDLKSFALLYRMMIDQADVILASVKKQTEDPDILKNDDQVEMELHNLDLDGKTKHPYVCLSINTERSYATILVEDGGKEIWVETCSNV